MHDWYSDQLSQCLSIPAADLPPANRANNTTPYAVGPVTANQFMRFLGSVSVGALTGAANVTAYLQSCNTSNGTFVNISATNATAFTNTANTVLTVECRADQLPSTGTSYVQLAVLVAANSAIVQGRVVAVAAHYEPASAFNFNTNNTVLIQTVY